MRSRFIGVFLAVFAHSPALAIRPVGVPYDCRGQAPDNLKPCPDGAANRGTEPLIALFEAADSDASASGQAIENWGKKGEALGKVLALDLSRLSLSEKIMVQSSALRIALAALYGGPKELRKQALGLVERLAPPSPDLVALGTEPAPELEAWLGPRAGWTERKVGSPSLFHENIYRLTRFARPLRVGSRRALFTQLVAVDSSGKPHITSLVAELELRRSQAAIADSCLAYLDPGALSCGLPAGLRPRSGEALSASLSGYMTVGKKRANCNSCHGREGRVLAFQVSDVPASGREAFLQARKDAFLADLSKQLSQLKISESPAPK